MNEATKLRARRGSILALGKLTIPKFEIAWFHKRKAALIEDVLRFALHGGARGGTPRAMFSEPRRHGKSLFCGELGPASFLGQNPGLKVMNTAYMGSIAGDRVQGTKRIMSSPHWPFPVRIGRVVDEKTSKTAQARDLAHSFQTMLQHEDGSVTYPGGGYEAVGVQGGATGRGYHLGIGDDWVKNPEEARSPLAMAKRQSFYETCFESGGEGDGTALLFVGTMWNKPDHLEIIYNRWVAQGFEPVWLRFSAIKDSELSFDQSDDPREEGEGLWLGKFSTAFYERMKAGLVHSGNIEHWAALWQQDPVGVGGVIFAKENWRYFGPDFDLGNIEELHFSVDPNVKDTGRSFGSIGVYGVVDRPMYGGVQYFKLARYRGHWDYDALRDALRHAVTFWAQALPHAAAHPVSRVWVEDKANGPALMADRTVSLEVPFEPVPKMASKETCYRFASRVVRQHRVRLPRAGQDTSFDESPVEDHWVFGRGNFVEELFAQQPVREPNDDADQFAQMVICRDPTLGPELLRLRSS